MQPNAGTDLQRVHKSNACGGGRRYSTVSTSLPRTSPAASRSNAERASAKGYSASIGGRRPVASHMSINRRSSARCPSSNRSRSTDGKDVVQVRGRLTPVVAPLTTSRPPGRRLRIECDHVALPTVSITRSTRWGNL